ncbi:MAG TPA: crossover junction endodeoxyribonuclease RuvC [Chthonomonadales bacterium]|nr:crossover junction endodeoxyribonuclease RuvC [Chthonomonadales bacterium]
MVILGVDPGLANTGYGVVRKDGTRLEAIEHGVLRTSPETDAPARLLRIHDDLCGLIERHRPDALVTERLFFSRNEATAFSVGRAIGVALLAGARHGLPWVEYTPTQVKEAVVGYGAAEKRQVQFMVQRILNLSEPPRPEHAADALAVAVCHAHTYRAEL